MQEIILKYLQQNYKYENIEAQVYYGKILDNGVVENASITPMKLQENEKTYTYQAKIELTTGGNYGYTFRVMPKHEMMFLDSENLNLIKWIPSAIIRPEVLSMIGPGVVYQILKCQQKKPQKMRAVG